jgi:hypothetical protein
MHKNPVTDRNNFSRPLPQLIALTPRETKQVAGGARGSTSREHSEPTVLTPVETKQVAGGSPYIPIPPGYAAHIHPYTPFMFQWNVIKVF